MKKRTVIGIVVVTMLALAAGVAYATIPDSNGVIHACYKTANGQLRVIDSNGCHPSETALSWSQTGPQGPPGATGPTGATGPQGPAGADSTKTVAGAVSPDGTSQLSTDDFTTTHLGDGHYRIDFAAGTFDAIPAVVVMPVGKAYVSGILQFPTGGAAFAADYFIVNIDTNTPADTLHNFVATPFTSG
jgi:hypothetical protein